MYTNDDLNKLSDEDRKKKLHSVQMDITIHESDTRKLAAEKEALDAELRKFRMDEERLRVAREEKQKRFDLVAREITEHEEEMKRLKKQLNLLT